MAWSPLDNLKSMAGMGTLGQVLGVGDDDMLKQFSQFSPLMMMLGGGGGGGDGGGDMLAALSPLYGGARQAAGGSGYSPLLALMGRGQVQGPKGLLGL